MPSHLTEADVAHIAELARLELSDADRKTMTGQLGDILAYAAMVQEVQTAGVAPAIETALRPDNRPDDPIPGLRRDDFLRDAPDAARDAGLFRVPKVL